MTAINISSDIATSFTTVSDIFIDQYMPKANGEFVKVYLYLLRATGSGAGIATISEIADHFSNTEADIIRALNYWASEGILQLQSGADGQIMGINLCSLSVSGMQATQSNIQSAVADNAAQNNLQNSVVNNAAQNNLQNSVVNNAAQNNLQNGVVNNAAQNISTADIRMQDSVVEKLKNQATDKPAPSQKEYTLDEIKEFRKNPDISELFFIIETYLKHTLSSTDTNMVLYWLDELHFSTDLVEYLVEYCITKGHSSLRFLSFLYPHQLMEVAIVAPTLRMMGVVTILISFAGIFNNVLQASGMERTPLTALLIGGVLKMVTNYILVSRPEINIHGVAYGSLLCYCFIVLYSALRWFGSGRPFARVSVLLKPMISAVVCCFAAWAVYNLLLGYISAWASLLFSIAVGGAVYIGLLFCLKFIKSAEICVAFSGKNRRK